MGLCESQAFSFGCSQHNPKRGSLEATPKSLFVWVGSGPYKNDTRKTCVQSLSPIRGLWLLGFG